MLAGMNWLLIASAAFGLTAAVGHAYLGERFVLRPMFKAAGDNRVLAAPRMRRLLRWVWRLPSFAWAQIAAATLWLVLAPAALDDGARALLVYFGVGIYMTGAVFNAWAIRGPHLGNIVLTLASLTLWFGAHG